MLSEKTIRRYLEECEDVLKRKDVYIAKKLEKEIVYALKSDVPNIKEGLERYRIPMFVNLWDPRNVDYLDEIELLRSKLKVMLESYENVSKNDFSQSFQNEGKPYKIFISYSDYNKKSVAEFVYFLQDLSIPKQNIICTAIPVFGVPIGKDIYEYLRGQFTDYNLYVIYMLSNEYYTSPTCLNEMGAAWVLRKECVSVLLPGFDPDNMKGVVDSRELYLRINEESMDDEFKHRLHEIYKKMQDLFNLESLSFVEWERKRDRFYQNFISACNS